MPPFDAGTAITQAKMALPEQSDRNRTDELGIALSMALADLSARLRSQAYLSIDTDTIAGGNRTHVIKGKFQDAKRIFALKLGDGVNERVLNFIDPQEFLRNYDSPDATAGSPLKYTILNSSSGFAEIKFEAPLEISETLTVYYFTEFTPDNIALVKCTQAVVAGTVAYFCGIATPAIYKYDPISKSNVLKRPSGKGYYDAFEKQAKLSRAADDYTPYAPIQKKLSIQDKNILGTVKNIHRGRS